MATACARLTGGFGNRLFVLAFLYAFGKRNSCRIKLDSEKNIHNSKADKTYKYIIDKFYAMPNYNHDEVKIEKCCIEKDFMSFDEFPKIEKNTFYGHSFQNEKYFDDYRSDILELFKCPDHIDLKDDTSDVMFIHVRLGDYLSSNHHFVDLTKYLKSCLEQTRGPYHLFCDTPQHLRGLYPFLLDRNDITLIDEKDELKAFYRMVKCGRGGVCSNSSFSWFVSWLNDNPNKQVFFPERWYNGRKPLLAYKGVTVIPV